jgi:hypothetical protein
MIHWNRFALIALTWTGVWPSQAAGQNPGWLPRQVRPITALNRTDRAAAIATLDRLERLVRQIPELAAPDGFQILPTISGGSRQLGPHQKEMPGSLVDYLLALTFFAPSKAVAGEGNSCIMVRVNPTQSGTLTDAEGRAIYIERERAKEPRGTPDQVTGILWQVPQATQVYGELWAPVRDIRAGRPERSGATVLFVGAGELPWLPVSRETFYQASLREQEGADGKNLAEFRAALATTPLARWMEEAPQRKKIRDDIVSAALRSQSAAEADKLREKLEADERQVTEQFRKTEAEDRERNQAALARSYAQRDALGAELERMTPAERAMPTYINNALEEGPIATGWRLTSDPTPPAWRVLTPNYDFYRARRSPVEARSIEVHIGSPGRACDPRSAKPCYGCSRRSTGPASIRSSRPRAEAYFNSARARSSIATNESRGTEYRWAWFSSTNWRICFRRVAFACRWFGTTM